MRLSLFYCSRPLAGIEAICGLTRGKAFCLFRHTSLFMCLVLSGAGSSSISSCGYKVLHIR